MTTSTSHLILKKAPKPLLTPAQKTFERLKRQIKTLQENEKAMAQELDTSLQFYYGKIRPEEEAFKNVLAERVKISYKFYKAPKGLIKKELGVLKDLIIDDINMICLMTDPCDVPSEIKEILKELDGVDYDELAAEELTFLKEEMQEMFKKFGADIDLSEIDVNDSQEEMIRNLFRSVRNATENQKNINQESKKSKKQQEKELKKHAFEEMQKKGISTIYKQLARALHPDLEKDNEQKVLKEELMRKLTRAYEQNDLCALLAMEMEWMNRSSVQKQSQSNEQLEIYNAILKDQAKALQANIDMLVLHPKYMPIQRFYGNHFSGMAILKRKYDLLKAEVQNLQKLVIRLQTADGCLKIFKAAIKDKHAMIL